MRAELCECEFYESQPLWMWILWELRFANVKFKRAEHCICEFYDSWVLRMWIYESWALQMWISWELSFLSVHVMSARLCILWVLSIYILLEDQCEVASEVKNLKGGWENLSRHKMEQKLECWNVNSFWSVVEVFDISPVENTHMHMACVYVNSNKIEGE